MRTFKIKLSSFLVFIILFLIMLIAGGFLLASILPKGTSVSEFFIYVAFWFAIYFLARRISTTMTCWTISQTELSIHWQSGIFFQKRPDILIKWDDIKAYKYRSFRAFDLFNINLKNGRSISFWHNTDFEKDDFYSCINYFEEKVAKQIKAEMVKGNQICP